MLENGENGIWVGNNSVLSRACVLKHFECLFHREKRSGKHYFPSCVRNFKIFTMVSLFNWDFIILTSVILPTASCV